MWPSASFAARVCAGVALAMSLTLGAGRRDYKDPDRQNSDISLWIDERQVRMFSGSCFFTTSWNIKRLMHDGFRTP